MADGRVTAEHRAGAPAAAAPDDDAVWADGYRYVCEGSTLRVLPGARGDPERGVEPRRHGDPEHPAGSERQRVPRLVEGVVRRRVGVLWDPVASRRHEVEVAELVAVEVVVAVHLLVEVLVPVVGVEAFVLVPACPRGQPEVVVDEEQL